MKILFFWGLMVAMLVWCLVWVLTSRDEHEWPSGRMWVVLVLIVESFAVVGSVF